MRISSLTARSRILLTIALAAAACHNSAPPPPTPLAAWDQILARIEADYGYADPQLALDAFVVAIGPLPDVATPPGARTIIRDADLAVDAVDGQREAFTDAQRAAVDRYLGGPIANTTPASTTDPQLQRFQTLIAFAAKQEAALIGVPAPTITVAISPTQDIAGAAAWTRGFDAQGLMEGPQTECKITIAPLLLNLDSDTVDNTVYHEVFHCFTNAMFSTLAAKLSAPPWIKEGSAEWVGTTLATSSQACTGCWKHWLTRPELQLGSRTYDALGFFAQLNREALTPWPRFPKIFRGWEAQRELGAVTAAMEGSSTFLDNWATSFVRKPALGSEWDASGPAITSDAVVPNSYTVANGSSIGEPMAALGNDVYRLELTADVVLLRTRDHSHLHAEDPAGLNLPAPVGNWCTRPGGCQCPSDSPRGAEKLADLPKGVYYAGISGGFQSGPWGAFGMTLDDYCRQPMVDPCLYGTWTVDRTNAGSAVPTCDWPRPFGAVLTIGKDNSMVEDFNPIRLITCANLTMKFAGQAIGAVTHADHGFMAGSMDLTAVTLDETLFGIDQGPKSLAELAGVAQLVSGFDSYSCSANSLTLSDPSGQGTVYLIR